MCPSTQIHRMGLGGSPINWPKKRIHADQDNDFCPLPVWWNIFAVHMDQQQPSVHTDKCMYRRDCTPDNVWTINDRRGCEVMN